MQQPGTLSALQNGILPTRQPITQGRGDWENVESFANLTSLYGDADPFSWQLARQFFPNMAKVFEGIMNE